MDTNENEAAAVTHELYPLSDLPARAWMPRRQGRNGRKPVNKFTCIRWALHGKGGVKLRTIMVGGIRCTCDAWAWEFFETLTRGKESASGSCTVLPADHKAAEAELDRGGF